MAVCLPERLEFAFNLALFYLSSAEMPPPNPRFVTPNGQMNAEGRFQLCPPSRLGSFLTFWGQNDTPSRQPTLEIWHLSVADRDDEQRDMRRLVRIKVNSRVMEGLALERFESSHNALEGSKRLLAESKKLKATCDELLKEFRHKRASSKKVE